MNAKIRLIIILITVMFLMTKLTAQSKWDLQKPPKPDNFDFDFGEYFKMSAEEEKKALAELKASLKDQLKTIKESNSNSYYKLLRESKFNNIHFPFMTKESEKDIERGKRIFELDVASEALVAKYQKANSKRKQGIKTELQKILNKLFEMREENRKYEVKELEKQLSELRKSLNIRIKNKKEIVKRRLQELLDEDDYLEWE